MGNRTANLTGIRQNDPGRLSAGIRNIDHALRLPSWPFFCSAPPSLSFHPSHPKGCIVRQHNNRGRLARILSSRRAAAIFGSCRTNIRSPKLPRLASKQFCRSQPRIRKECSLQALEIFIYFLAGAANFICGQFVTSHAKSDLQIWSSLFAHNGVHM